MAKAANCTGGPALTTVDGDSGELLRGGKKAPPFEECLMNATWQQVLIAQTAAETDVKAEFGQFLSLFQPYSAVVGVDELPKQPFTMLLVGLAHDIPVIFGSVRQEGLLFIYSAYPTSKLSRTDEGVLLGAI